MNHTVRNGTAVLFVMMIAGPALAHGGEEEPGRLLQFLAGMHPMVVHFPIALILAAALAEFLNLVRPNQVFEDAARLVIVLAALGAAAAAGLGFAAEDFHAFAGDYVEVVETHEFFGLGALAAAIIAAGLSEFGRRRPDPRLLWAYRAALVIAAGLVTGAGYFGGELVHGIGHLWE